jgi:His/Glu/Gln/Arg/opine family amino acid ABC transporter permease subunit
LKGADELSGFFENIRDEFILNFIDDNRWRYLVNGLGVTLQITLGALVLGILIGVVVAIIRSTHDKTRDTMRPGYGRVLLKIINALCKIYLTVIRGIPVVVQILIAYFIIFASSNNGVLVGILAFGINSGAYVAEIFRSGIMSIDAGQMEAGRSLGFNYVQTMRHIIIPQAFKNVLPALLNELIALLKETAVVGYIAVKDLTKGADIIRGRTFSPFMPLLAAALIYLLLVMFFSWLVGRLERRLRSSDH